MESSRRPFDRSREGKRARMSDEPSLRDPRLLNSGGVRSVRDRQIERDEDANDLNGGGYFPTHQLFSELVSEYRKGLAELIVNSKPIITNLTIIAGENLHAAKSIAEAICSHIIEVPSEQKLPSLYLLDSIVKNIGRDYIKYFSTKLPEVFCKAYKQADPSIHAGLRHLFRTWEGVFPLRPLQMIEKELGISLAVNGSGPVSARSKPDPQSQYPQKGIHVNPKYLEARQKLQPPSRVKGPTNDIVSNVMQPTGNAARLGFLHREPVRESLYGNDAEVAFDDYDLSLKKSGIGEHDRQWYGTGTNMADAEPVLGQRNGYDGKRKLGSYASPQSHVSRTNGGMPRSWKNNEEEEYLWDDINSGVIKHSTPTDPRKDIMGFDEPDDMEADTATLPVATSLQSIQSADYARVRGVTSAGASSSLGRKSLQPQMIRNPISGALARSQANNSPTIVQKRPPPPSRQPTLRQWSPSPSFSSGHVSSSPGRHAEIDLPVSQSMQRAVSKSSEFHERDNIRPRGQLKRDSSPIFSQTGKKQLVDSQKSKGTSSVLPTQQRMQQHSLPGHSRPEGKLSEPISEALTSGTSVAEAVQNLTSSGLFSAMLNSGVLSKGVSIPNPKVESEDMPEPLHSDVQPPVCGALAGHQMPAVSITASSQACKAASVSKRIGALSQTTSTKALSKREGEEKTAVANPYSNLLSTLMEKGLLTRSKNELPTAVLPSNESKSTVPGAIGKSMMTTPAPDSSSNSSLFGGENLSALDSTVHNAVDNAAPEIKNLIGFEFKPSLIRQLHKLVIEDLIDGLPYRCDICGLRLKLQERLDKHMEWHSSKELDNEYGASRRWFQDLDDWVTGNSFPAVNPDNSADETEEAFVEVESCLVPADENQCACILCGELFEDYYNHEEDGWMFRGAMQVNLSGPGYESMITGNIPNQDLIVHTECFSESSARELGLVAKVKTVRRTSQEFP